VKKSQVFFRRIIQSAWDFFSWTLSIPIATLLRYDIEVGNNLLLVALKFGIYLGIIQITISFTLQAIRGRFVIGSFDEIFSLSFGAGIVVLIGFLSLTLDKPPILPRSVPFIAGSFALGVMLAGRFLLRSYRQRFKFNKNGELVLIYGAGESGDQIVRQMLYTKESLYIPVGFLDDDQSKRNLRIHGVRVLGTLTDLEKFVTKFNASTLVVAISGIYAADLLKIDRRCSALNVKLRVIPTTTEIIGKGVKLGDISDVTNDDLLGRRPIKTDETSIKSFLKGKRVLITGAGGSIGSELTRQVYRYEPSIVGILDRDESAIHEVQLSIDGQGLLINENLILADIRDKDRLVEIFDTFKPEIVFHAAALKHLPLLERYPEEAHKTNVVGTQNILAAAAMFEVNTFINISTDKAADPTSVLGRTKLETERLTAQVKTSGSQRYVSVRFGNVLGSRGSVTTAFRYQIEKGGPVTVTDPEVTRYFMTIPEAVHLVLQAAVIGEHGETLILDMGNPVKILDVAKQMIEKSGRDIEIIFTGLRDGEKLNENLFSVNEQSEKRKHPLISHTRVKS
jgi:dTDP-glucose 4,6-dehydratase